MRIGELAAQANVSTRQVRYYEAKGLISSDREANGYRDYDDIALGRVLQIRELLGAGLSVQMIRCLLPCLESPCDPIVFDGVTPHMVLGLKAEVHKITQRIDVLIRNRDAVAGYLHQLQQRSER